MEKPEIKSLMDSVDQGKGSKVRELITYMLSTKIAEKLAIKEKALAKKIFNQK